MIPRLLVPVKLAPVTVATDGRHRAWTILDDRTLVPAELPVRALETESKIPLHMPLDVLGERTLIAREAVPGELELPRPGESYLPTDADERVAVPVDAHPEELVAETTLPIEVLEREDLVTTDVFTTGQVQFMPREVSDLPRDWSWVVPAVSIALHLFLVGSVLGTYALFPHHDPTAEELEAASRNLGIVYLPGSMFDKPKASPRPAPPGDKLRVDPGMIKRTLPEVAPSPPPAPSRAPSPRLEDLPSAPVPRTTQPPSSDALPRGPQPLRVENPPEIPDNPTPKLKLPSMSPGRALEDAARGSASRPTNNAASFGGYIPHGSGGGGYPGGGGGGEGYLGGAVQMLTPDEGVDFNSYLARVLASVKRNWYSIMPESAKLGDRGRVILDFKIQRDGVVPMAEPILRSTSGKDPLDRAAMSSIRASSPFEPLPGAFSGPYIELRFIFLYNMPLEAAQ